MSRATARDCKVGAMAESEIILEHPNRETAASKSTRAVVVLLLLISVVLMAIVTIGAWSEIEGTKPELVAYILVYLLMVFMVLNWRRGALPVTAGLAIVLAIFAAVAVPGWFDRDADGFHQAAVSASLAGMLCAILIPIQILLIGFAMRGFNQAWNVEIERTSTPQRSAPQTA
jgi:hypothetical protein